MHKESIGTPHFAYRMRYIAFLSALICLAGCGLQRSGSVQVALNTVEGVNTRQVIYDGQPWVEITVTQRIDPKAPAYVVGIRNNKWANQLRWALVEQKLDREKVTTRFRVHPVNTNEFRLDKDDFEWYPQVSGFQPINVALKGVEQGTTDR